MSLPLFFICFSCFYRKHVTMCFVINLLQQVVMSSTISLFMGFALTIQMTKFDPRIIRSNNVCQYTADLES